VQSRLGLADLDGFQQQEGKRHGVVKGVELLGLGRVLVVMACEYFVKDCGVGLAVEAVGAADVDVATGAVAFGAWESACWHGLRCRLAGFT
jgi:hypothetical protein